MALRIITADERLAEANLKTTMAIFGPSGVGKTSLLKTLPARRNALHRSRSRHEVGAGLAGRQHSGAHLRRTRSTSAAWSAASIRRPIATRFFSEAHYRHLCETYPDLVEHDRRQAQRSSSTASPI